MSSAGPDGPVVRFEIAERLRRWVRTHLDLDVATSVSVRQRPCAGADSGPVETVLSVLGTDVPLTGVVALPAEEVCIADVQRAFDVAVSSRPGRSAGGRRT